MPTSLMYSVRFSYLYYMLFVWGPRAGIILFYMILYGWFDFVLVLVFVIVCGFVVVCVLVVVLVFAFVFVFVFVFVCVLANFLYSKFVFACIRVFVRQCICVCNCEISDAAPMSALTVVIL